MTLEQDRIAIAILALGGEGGGVLANWIQEVGRAQGWLVQGTSVPGVAQRTGSTVYYVELARPDPDGREPVLAQMPMPGEVDVVVASELMETGRALLRGFSTAARTTLIGSTHRVYAIGEKMAPGDGRGNGAKILAAAQERSARFIGFDMAEATDRTGSAISAVMFGALAGSGALPFDRAAFEQAIQASGIAVASNLAGFAEGYRAAQEPLSVPGEPVPAVPVPTTERGRALAARAERLPGAAWANLFHGLARLMDYQDAAYAALFLDRVEQVAALDAAPWTLTSEIARHLAVWMSYDDAIRVADLKTGAGRIERVRREVRAGEGQLLSVTEYMHPRLREICETLPPRLGRAVLSRPGLSRVLSRLVDKGRHVETTGLMWFILVRAVAALRPLRPRSVRYAEEQERIDHWLGLVAAAARFDRERATELARCQGLIKGYGDTFDRSLGKYRQVVAAAETHGFGAEAIRRLREAALRDETEAALSAALAAEAEALADERRSRR